MPDPSPKAPEDRHHRWLIVSAIAHGAVLLALGLIPPPDPPPRDPFADLDLIDVLEIPEPDPVPAPAPVPVPERDPEPDPEPDLDPDPAPRPDRRDPEKDDRGTGTVLDPAELPDVDPGPTTEPTPGKALALNGLRSSSRPSRSAPAPRGRIGYHGGKVDRKIGGAAESELEGPRLPNDKPRTLAEAGFVRDRRGNLVFKDHRRRFKATIKPGGRLVFKDYAWTKDGPIAPGAALVRSGQDMHASLKKKLLDATFDLRLNLAIDWASEKMQTQLKRLVRDLAQVWRDDSRTKAQRRKALFELWDECEEALKVKIGDFGTKGKSRLDEARRETGDQARKQIEAFIRKNLAKGGEDQYTGPELRKLNGKRRSRARFEPYTR